MKQPTNPKAEMPKPKFAKPRIMLIDMDDSTNQVLRGGGFNVIEASFGKPRRVRPSDEHFPIDHSWAKLTGHEEQEILIINTASPDGIEDDFCDPGDGVESLWQVASKGIIDARPLAMRGIQESVDAILDYGGIAIVQAGRNYSQSYLLGSKRGRFNFYESERFELSSFDLSSDLRRVCRENASGEEIKFLDSGHDLARLLSRGAVDARYQVRIGPNYDQETYWMPLANDKFGCTVAALLMQDDPKKVILMLPQMPNFHVIAVELIQDWCAKWRPHLFPFHDKQAWLYSDRYEMASINKKKAQIKMVRTEAEAAIEKLKAEIESDRKAHSDWYTLLNGTGEELVQAVMNSLRKLGFKDVVDMDEEALKCGADNSLREDVQVRDRAPVLVVDVKGVVGTPGDDESTQSQKHATMRTRELNQFVKPLTIINHQRNLPPHERTPEPYRIEIIQNAEVTGLGLMTTWDLFLLMRNQENLNWTHEQVSPIFYRDGRISPHPEHYEEVGAIVHVWEHSIGVVPKKGFPKGSTLAIKVNDLFHEVQVNEIKIDGNPAELALQGANCGIACNDTTMFREKMRVFLMN